MNRLMTDKQRHGLLLHLTSDKGSYPTLEATDEKWEETNHKHIHGWELRLPYGKLWFYEDKGKIDQTFISHKKDSRDITPDDELHMVIDKALLKIAKRKIQILQQYITIFEEDGESNL